MTIPAGRSSDGVQMAPAQGNLVNRERILFGLALSGIAIVLIAIVYRIDSHQSLGTVEPQREEAMQAQKASSTDAEVNESEGVVVPQPSLGDEQNIATTEPLSDTGYVPPPGFVDEETSNKMVREEATRDVPKLYSLLLESLDLTPSEKDALLALLIEDRIASTTTPYSRGMEIDEQDRAKRIAGIMGDPKLQQFLALERNLGSYAEIQYVETVLQQHANPITESQRDRMLEILIDVKPRVCCQPSRFGICLIVTSVCHTGVPTLSKRKGKQELMTLLRTFRFGIQRGLTDRYWPRGAGGPAQLQSPLLTQMR